MDLFIMKMYSVKSMNMDQIWNKQYSVYKIEAN